MSVAEYNRMVHEQQRQLRLAEQQLQEAQRLARIVEEERIREQVRRYRY